MLGLSRNHEGGLQMTEIRDMLVQIGQKGSAEPASDTPCPVLFLAQSGHHLESPKGPGWMLADSGLGSAVSAGAWPSPWERCCLKPE